MKIINASFYIKKDEKESFLAAVKPLIESSRKEKGCLAYNLFESFEDPNHFVMIENWESQEAINEHNKNPLLKELLENIPTFSTKQPVLTVSNTEI
ncbi:MAG: antibiotic biosynthesis monooxygenase [Alkalibacterium sp.]|nr:antibiotic biosynthesis monooxygenase [Alkalibacterium sp.]